MLERRRAIEQDRARIARDIHDDLGAGLTQISLFAELLRRSPRSEAELHSQRISETAQSLARAMDGIVWAVNSKNDTLESLITYLSGFASEFLRSAGLKCRLEMPAKVPPVVVTSEIRNHVLVALKETLNNVVKHAQASEVHLRAVYAERVLNITIHDDGRGFAPDGAAHRAEGRVASGNGLVNLGQRMSALGGTCRVRPGLRGRGTIVEFMVPIVGEGLAT
jgi:signal transduction histidine kinase